MMYGRLAMTNPDKKAGYEKAVKVKQATLFPDRDRILQFAGNG